MHRALTLRPLGGSRRSTAESVAALGALAPLDSLGPGRSRPTTAGSSAGGGFSGGAAGLRGQQQQGGGGPPARRLSQHSAHSGDAQSVPSTPASQADAGRMVYVADVIDRWGCWVRVVWGGRVVVVCGVCVCMGRWMRVREREKEAGKAPCTLVWL